MVEKLLHFALKILLYFASKLSHFAATLITFCDSITICGLTVGSKFSPKNLIEWISHLLTALDLRKTSSLSIRSVMFRKVCSISTMLLPFDNMLSQLYGSLLVIWSCPHEERAVCDHIETTTQTRWILTLKNGCCFTDK